MNSNSNSNNGRLSFKAPTEGLEDTAFDTANPYKMAVNFHTNIEALANHVGTNFRKATHVVSMAIWKIKAPVITGPDASVGKDKSGKPNKDIKAPTAATIK